MPTILAGDLNQNKLIEYELITNQNKSVKMNEIPVPKKYASYKLINVIIKAGKYIVLVFKNDNEQVLVRLKPYSKIKSKNQDYRFEKLAKINPDIDLSKAEYIHSDKLEEYKLVIFTEHEIKELELKI